MAEFDPIGQLVGISFQDFEHAMKSAEEVAPFASVGLRGMRRSLMDFEPFSSQSTLSQLTELLDAFGMT